MTIETTTICGTDLHILKGDVPAVTQGRILGHEGVGVVTEVGPECTEVKVGDRVIVSCVTTCMDCDYCRCGLTSHCQTVGGIGWIFGHLIDGTQAERVRVPFADNGLIPLPQGVTPEQGVMISDILPTGYEIGAPTAPVRAAGRSRPSRARCVSRRPAAPGPRGPSARRAGRPRRSRRRPPGAAARG